MPGPVLGTQHAISYLCLTTTLEADMIIILILQMRKCRQPLWPAWRWLLSGDPEKLLCSDSDSGQAICLLSPPGCVSPAGLSQSVNISVPFLLFVSY
jgi:hypothetical protein